MSESLNRAFIKAYDREKSNVAKRQIEATKLKEQQELDLIVRFDTSSINIPQPHANQPHAPEPKVFEAQVSEARVPEARVLRATVAQSHSANSVAESATLQQSQAVREPLAIQEDDQQLAAQAALRASIAAQMMQAGNWSDPRIDAFIGGFPSIAANPPAATSTERETAVANTQRNRQPAAELVTPQSAPSETGQSDHATQHG